MAIEYISKGNDDGTSLGQSATDKISLYGGTPVVQAGAYTQAYSTAARTVPDATVVDPAAPTAYTALASGAVAVVSAAAEDLTTTSAALKTLRDEVATYKTAISALVADVLALKKVITALVDDLQGVGISG